MNLRDRVKQAAVAVSDTAYTFSGAAEDGFRTFAEAFRLTDQTSSTYYIYNVPILVQTNTAWQVVIGRLVLNATTDVASLDNGIVHSSSTGAALALAASTAVTVTLVDSADMLGLLAVAPAPQRVSATDHLTWVESKRPTAYPGSLMAVGAGALAGNSNNTEFGSVAIGNNVNCDKGHSWARGERMIIWRAGEDAFGLKGYLNPLYQTIANVRGVMNKKTTDATPVDLNLVQYNGTDATAANEIQCYKGLTVIDAVITAIDTATYDIKRWTVSFAVKTNNSWTSSLFGTLSKTVVQADAGASTWDVGVTVADNYATIQVTGEAATTIIWGCTYEAHHNELNSV